MLDLKINFNINIVYDRTKVYGIKNMKCNCKQIGYAIVTISDCKDIYQLFTRAKWTFSTSPQLYLLSYEIWLLMMYDSSMYTITGKFI